jgi:SAM-dependent methyltransferase
MGFGVEPVFGGEIELHLQLAATTRWDVSGTACGVPMTAQPGAKGLEYLGRDLEAMASAVNYHSWIIGECRAFLGDEVAEVGAGAGDFSEFILGSGVRRLVSFEPSPNMFPLLKQRLAGRPGTIQVQGYLGDRAEEDGQRFDSVVYINVLEHIENQDEEMALARAVTRPGGHIVVFVPAIPLLYSRFDRELGHVRRYTRTQLKRLAKRARLEIVSIKYMDLLGIIPWFLAFTVAGGSLTPGTVALYDRFVVPFARRAERSLPPPVGKNLLLIARR